MFKKIMDKIEDAINVHKFINEIESCYKILKWELSWVGIPNKVNILALMSELKKELLSNEEITEIWTWWIYDRISI